MQAQEYFRDPSDKLKWSLGEMLSLDQLVPGRKDSLLLCASSITGDPWFGHETVQKASLPI